MKRITSLALSAALLASLSTPVLAAPAISVDAAPTAAVLEEENSLWELPQADTPDMSNTVWSFAGGYIDGGEMTAVKETFKIGKAPDGSIRSFADSEEGVALDGESPVSMNFWGFTPWALDEMETYFHTFLRSETGKELKSECLLPTMVGDMLREGSMHVDAYTTEEAWFGMTYHEDRATTAAMLRKLTAEGMYPETLY